MHQELLINIAPFATRVAHLENGIVQEVWIEDTQIQGFVGNIYKGKVTRIAPALQSTFVEIGLERSAFLHVNDIWYPPIPTEPETARQPIEKILSPGQIINVQVIKDPIGSKGARLSTQISLAGRLLVYLPQENHIGISHRISDLVQRELLKNRLQNLLPPNTQGGFIIRTNALEASDEAFLRDIRYLETIWNSIQERAKQQVMPGRLYADLNLAQRTLRDEISDKTTVAIVDDFESYSKLQQFAEGYMPDVVGNLVHYNNSQHALFEVRRVEEEIEKALQQRVDLKSGGYLMIDQTEAMTVIDINTGSLVRGYSVADSIVKTNLEAAHALARQIRLRNLGGIILVDFINMQEAEHRTTVLEELKKTLANDRMIHSCSDFSANGLIEITRQRRSESLTHTLCEPCKYCNGKGYMKTAQSVCHQILRDILREDRQFNPNTFRIVASQSVIDLFLESEATHLAKLSEQLKKTIALQVETLYLQDQYDILLL